jgi:outer membrane protein assembly factor BamB
MLAARHTLVALATLAACKQQSAPASTGSAAPMPNVSVDAGPLDATPRRTDDAARGDPESAGDISKHRRGGPATLAWRSTKLVSSGDGEVAILLLADGTVVRRGWNLEAWRDGKRLWKLDQDAERWWIVELATGLVVGLDAKIAALDPATGAERWSTKVPTTLRVGAGGIAPDGSLWVTPGEDVFRLDLTKCAAKLPCVHKLPGNADGAGAGELAFFPDGRALVVPELKLLDRTGNMVGSIVTDRDVLSALPLANGKLAVNLAADELLLLDAARCRRRVALSGVDRDTCRDCKPAPSGCVAKRVAAGSLGGPIALGNDVVYTADGVLVRANASLATKWKTAAHVRGAPVAVGDELLVLCELEGSDFDDDLGVCMFDRNGKQTGSFKTGYRIGMLDDFEGLWARDRWILVRRGGSVRMFRR